MNGRAPFQQTPSGIVVASPDSGFRVTYLHTDVPGLAWHALEQPEEFLPRWLTFCSSAGGQSLELTDPVKGEAWQLLRTAIPHVLTVCPSYLPKIHPRIRS